MLSLVINYTNKKLVASLFVVQSHERPLNKLIVKLCKHNSNLVTLSNRLVRLVFVAAVML